MKTLPKGKLNIRNLQGRGCWQVYAGTTYLAGCSGDSTEVAVNQLCGYYEVPQGTKIAVHGYFEATTITITTL